MDEGFVEVELIEPREAHIYFELPIGLRFEFVWLAQSSKFLQYYGYYNFMKTQKDTTQLLTVCSVIRLKTAADLTS
ncbi:hypothetical protein AAMO2058_001282600 [Amorphochlora amoebiformis]